MCPIIQPENTELIFRIECKSNKTDEKFGGIGSVNGEIADLLMYPWLKNPYWENKLHPKLTDKFFFTKKGFDTFFNNNPNKKNIGMGSVKNFLDKNLAEWILIKRFVNPDEYEFEDEYQVIVNDYRPPMVRIVIGELKQINNLEEGERYADLSIS